MAESAIDTLFDEKISRPEPEARPEAKPEAVKPAEGLQRDESGRFAAKEPPAPVAPEPVAAKPEASPEAAKPDPKTDPFFKGMLDERDRRQKAERERDELRAKLQPDKVPSIQENPEAYQEWQQQQIRQAAVENLFNVSEVMAREKHTDAVVDAAIAWGHEQLSSTPGFLQNQLAQKHPMDWLVRQHKKDMLLKEMGDDDPDTWAEKRLAAKAAKNQPVTPAAPAAIPQPAPQKPAPPSRSLVHLPASGGGAHAEHFDEDTAFGATFKR